MKVGGHQASSASMVSLMTALYFGVLEAPDRVSVKPHASPVLHAINHLLGRLDASYLTKLREYGGLQSYPSRTKDPDPVDYSTGSVGLGATAPIWGALAHRYVAGHFDVPRGGRQIALIGDAELDEGACWEAIADPMVARLGEVMWVVDLNRQSLDRVVPDIAAGRLAAMFEAAGWHTVMVKYGPRLTQRPDLRARIDAMPNEEYQRLLRAPAPELRERIEVDVDDLDDADLLATFRDLGGHDLASLLDGYRQADAVRDRPSVVFAYTIKGWSLPTEGHPANHSALLNHEQYRGARRPPRRGRGRPVHALRRRLARGAPVRGDRPPPQARRDARRARAQGPARPRPQAHRQDLHAAGLRPLLRRPHARGARRRAARRDRSPRRRHEHQPRRLDQQGGHLERRRPHRLVRRRHRHARALARARPRAPHRARDRRGQPRRPAGRARRDLVARRPAAAAGRHDLRPVRVQGARAVVVRDLRRRPVDPGRHPDGRHARPRGRRAPVGDHAQSIGIEQPGCVAYEPAFGQDFEWCFLHALSQLGKPGGTSAYFRLSTRPIDQRHHTGTREEAIAGGYKLRPHDTPAISIAVMGALVPEALEAADTLTHDAGIDVEVVCITSADLLFRSFQARSGLGDGDPRTLEQLFRKGVPIVSLLDGHPHTLSFLGSPITCLGVQRFGQAGDIAELYEHHEIDAESVVGAALDLLG